MKFSLRRVRLNSGGYDSYGRYWGTGQPLFYYEDVSVNHDYVNDFIRADSREHAKEKPLAKYPNATFTK